MSIIYLLVLRKSLVAVSLFAIILCPLITELSNIGEQEGTKQHLKESKHVYVYTCTLFESILKGSRLHSTSKIDHEVDFIRSSEFTLIHKKNHSDVSNMIT